MKFFRSCLLGGVAPFCFAQVATAEIRYNIVGIGDYQNPNISRVFSYALNNHGDAVGWIPDSSGYAQPYWYTDFSGLVNLGSGASSSIFLNDINDDRRMIGVGDNGAVFFSLEGGFQSLPFTPTKINNAGTIVGGYRPVAGAPTHAYQYLADGTFQDLGTLGGTYSVAGRINNLGWIVGDSTTANGEQHAFLYRDGIGMVSLGLGSASGINDHGVVIGWNASQEPVIFRDGQMFPIGTFSGRAGLNAINNSGVAIGTQEQGFSSSAFIWSASEGVMDLNTLVAPGSGWHFGAAYDINDSGQIVGVGTYNGLTRAFRLDPVPEPSTWALLILGGLTFIACRLKSRR